MTYEPSDDTYLLLTSVQKDMTTYDNTSQTMTVCEVGCGSGEIITTLAQEFSQYKFFASDINPQSIKDTNQLAKEREVSIYSEKGSLLEPFAHQRFDIVIFNTPYLPCEENDRYHKLSIEDRALYGGQCGYEVTIQFLDSLLAFIHEHTKIYILISTLTQPNIVEDVMRGNGMEFEVISTQKLFFEELLVYRIYPSAVLRHLISSHYTNIERFDKGRHSYILQAQHPFQKQFVIIKFGKQQHIEKELKFLQKLQTTTYAPQIIYNSKDFIIYTKIEGITIEQFLKQVSLKQFSSKEIEIVINRCFEICFDLDIRGICKDEMTHPNEHIFINPKHLRQVHFIDFERSVFSTKRSNSTQFLQFILRNSQILNNEFIEISRERCIQKGKEMILRDSPLTLTEIVVKS